MRWIAVAAAATLAAACGQGSSEEAGEAAVATDAAVNVELRQAAPAPTAPAARTPTPGAASAPAPAVSAPLLAYRHTVELELPARRVRPLLARHEAACADAGVTVCQVIAVNTEAEGRDRVGATLELRARPDWLRRFRALLEGDAQAAGGRVTGSGTETEDLTRAIVDTEAQLRAKTTLRARLERLLAERPGKLEELLQVEQELTRVQGEIDSGLSNLAVMRTRVNTSALAIRYASAGAPVQDGVFSPLSEAVNGFLHNLVAGVAALVTLVSWLLPFALVLGGLGWVVLKLRRRFGRKRG